MFPKAKTLTLTAVILFFSACQLQATVINSRWVGGGYGLWSDASNWSPAIVPDNSDGQTFAITIDSNSIGANWVSIGLQNNQTVNQLDCYGGVKLFNNTPDWIELTLVDPNGLTNYGELEIEGERRMQINGNVTNSTGKELELWGMIEIVGDLYNSAEAKIKAGGTDIGIDGNVVNGGTIVIDPETEFWADLSFDNNGRIQMYGGQCESGEIFDNNNTGDIRGFGVIHVDQLLRNIGAVYAYGGSLAVLSEGSLTNIGVLGNYPLSSLHIRSAEDVNNLGTIEVNAGGGVAFDCNLVNEQNAVIKLLGGILAARTITQKADATLEGFGGITGNVVIETKGVIKLTGPTNIVGDVNIDENAVLEISEGTVLITGHTTCNGTIRLKGGRIIPQGGLSGNCNIISEPSAYTNITDFNIDGQSNLKDFLLAFANVWL